MLCACQITSVHAVRYDSLLMMVACLNLLTVGLVN